MITIEFDRAKMRRYLLSFLAVFLAAVGLAAVIAGLLLPDGAVSGRPKWLVPVMIGITLSQVLYVVQHLGLLVRGLAKKTPAVMVNRIGITDNSSDIAPGQLAWAEIEKMYPCEMKLHLITNWWAKMPVLFKQRGVAISLKDDADLRHLLRNQPRWVKFLSTEWYRSGKCRWLFIPEMVLPITADDLMSQINKFYVTEVRGG